MQLADSEPIGIHDEHHGGVGHVHTDLNHCRTHQDIDLARIERRHHGVLLLRGQPSMQQTDP
ncbi:Uncharacterised protein [Mycobacteroides abscessus subsp. massiliense]|nr:Uncharacterised protein [Mycobacteroides abscessus subsp. massiliense]